MKNKHIRALILLLMAAAFVLLCACGMGEDDRDRDDEEEEEEEEEDDRPSAPTLKEDEARQMAEALLDGLLSGEGSGEVLVLNPDGSVGWLTSLDGVALSYVSLAECTVTAVEQDGDTVTLSCEITAPDINAAMDAVLADMDEYDEAAFLEGMEDYAESDECPMRSFEAGLELRWIEGQWVFVPGYDFVNAITGGFYEAYNENQQQLIDTLEGSAG